jgi:hypothetical protein
LSHQLPDEARFQASVHFVDHEGLEAMITELRARYLYIHQIIHASDHNEHFYEVNQADAIKKGLEVVHLQSLQYLDLQNADFLDRTVAKARERIAEVISSSGQQEPNVDIMVPRTCPSKSYGSGSMIISTTMTAPVVFGT